MGWGRGFTATIAALAIVFVGGVSEAAPSKAAPSKVAGDSSSEKKVEHREQPSIAVFGATIEGDVHPAWRGSMVERLIDGLRRSGREVLGPADDARLAEPPCTVQEPTCRERLRGELETGYFVRLHLREDARNYDIRIEMVDARSGEVVASSVESCTVCGAAEVGELVADQAAALHEKLASLALHAPRIRFDSDPPGVSVYIDGELAGRTPMEREVAPGDRRIEFRKDGYLDQERVIKATSGVIESMEVSLQLRNDPIEVKALRNKRGRVAAWSLLGVGAASLAAGITFLVIDERPYRAECSGPNVDAFGNCRRRYNSMEYGAAFTSIGAAALVVSSVLFIVMRPDKRSSSDRAQLSLGVSPRGLAVRGRF